MLRLDYTPNLNQKIVPNLKDFLTANNSDFFNMPNNFSNNKMIKLSNIHNLSLVLLHLIRMRALFLFCLLSSYFSFYFCYLFFVLLDNTLVEVNVCDEIRAMPSIKRQQLSTLIALIKKKQK